MSYFFHVEIFFAFVEEAEGAGPVCVRPCFMHACLPHSMAYYNALFYEGMFHRNLPQLSYFLPTELAIL